jgi:uncharacterized protein YcfJ
MEPQYPTNLFAAIAKNILLRQKGLPATATILKEASDASDPATAFSAKYNFTPQDFSGDPTARKIIDPKQREAAARIRGYFQEQAKMLGGMNANLTHHQQAMLAELEQKGAAAKIQKSIGATMATEAQNPQRFGEMVGLSHRSQEALQHSHAPTISSLVGALGGTFLGSSLGKSPVKKIALGALGAGIGGLAGASGGRALAEHNTGYRYDDVLKPYEVAGRMDRQLHNDVKK